MINVLILNDDRHHFDNIAEQLRVTDEVDAIEVSTIEEAVTAIRDKVFHIILGEIDFDGIPQCGAKLAMQTFEENRTTAIIIDPSSIQGSGEKTDTFKEMHGYFIDTIRGLIRLRKNRILAERKNLS